MKTTQDSWARIEKGLTMQRPNAVIVNDPQLESYVGDVDKWVVENTEPPHSRAGREYVFNNERDTIMFILRWG
jgi:hypothetical protein